MQLDHLAAARQFGELGPVAGARYAELLRVEEALLACGSAGAADRSPADTGSLASALGRGSPGWAPPGTATVIVVDADAMASDLISLVLSSMPNAHVVSVATAPDLDAVVRTGDEPDAKASVAA